MICMYQVPYIQYSMAKYGKNIKKMYVKNEVHYDLGIFGRELNFTMSKLGKNKTAYHDKLLINR